MNLATSTSVASLESGSEEPSVSINENNKENKPIRRRRKNANLEYIKSKKRYFDEKRAEWEQRRQEKVEKENNKNKLLKKKLVLESRKVRALEELIQLKKRKLSLANRKRRALQRNS